jgi:nucleoside-diphosphate-sugar epimerase
LNNSTITSPILVTGAGGFIAAHTILLLLEQGYRVRGTLRDLKREPELRATLAQHTKATDALEFVRADLLQEQGWADAVRGCEYVIHAASPFPLHEPKDENELIAPARDGTIQVLKTAQAEGVKRVVIVSSSSAILPGHEGENRTFDEKDWARLDRPIGAYSKSKTLAERAAWEYITSAENTDGMELVSVNPGYVFGPFLDKHYATSMELVSTLMKHQVPGVSHSKFSFVDVRDVAAALSSAITVPEAAGKRFCCVTATSWLQSIALTLHKQFASRGYRVPTRQVPNILIRALGLFDPKVAIVVPALDWDYQVSNERAKAILHWQPLPPEQTLVDMGESMIALGLV